MSENAFETHPLALKPLVLAVDDDENNLLAIKRPLIKEGYDCMTCSSGPEALEILKYHEVDLVLLDWMMPGMTGLDVIRQVKQDPELRLIPIIMLTARDTLADLREGLGAGADDYLMKPVNKVELMSRVKAGLRARAIQKELKESNDNLLSLNKRIKSLNKELELKNRFIREVFGRYLSDEIAESLLETPEGLKMGGEKKKVTIIMTDLRGFSSLSERLGPEAVVKALNNYLSVMTEVIDSYGGVIDEFIGDAIMAIFGAPQSRSDDAERAVACAVAMQLAMSRVNEKNRAEGLPDVEMGVGVNTGEVIVGNIGSFRRAKYGIVGKTVNLTARIESYTTGGQILISRSTFDEVSEIAETAEEITISAKGASEPLALYDVTGIGGEHGLRLPETKVELADVKRKIPVLISVMEKKFTDEKVMEGAVIKIGEREAVIETAVKLDRFTDIELRLTGDFDEELATQSFYGKVLRAPKGKENALLVRFTYIPPEVGKFFSTLNTGKSDNQAGEADA